MKTGKGVARPRLDRPSGHYGWLFSIAMNSIRTYLMSRNQSSRRSLNTRTLVCRASECLPVPTRLIPSFSAELQCLMSTLPVGGCCGPASC